MRLSFVLAFSALTALASAQEVVVTEKCTTFMKSMASDANLNKCFPVASLIPVMNNDAFQNPKTLKSIFTQICTPTSCPQADVDALAVKMADACAADDTQRNVITSIGKLYTPLSKAVCYVNLDRDFVVAKDILALKLDMNKIYNSDINSLIALAQAADICTKGNQHIVGTVLDYVKGSPDLTTYFAQSQDVTMKAFTEKCGADFANGLASATGPPYPDVQKSFLQSSDATCVSSFSALPVILSVAALATQF